MLLILFLKSWFYCIVKSPITSDWAFYLNLHVPRLLLDHCSTVLFRILKKLKSVLAY